jgi:hypothetical protein
MSVPFVGKCPVTVEIKLDNKLCECQILIIIKVKWLCRYNTAYQPVTEDHRLVSAAYKNVWLLLRGAKT